MINDALKQSYIVLFVSLIMSFYGALNSNGLIRDILINLFVTIIGIFVTVFLIDRVIRKDAERKRRRILRTAFKRIPIEKQFSLFMTIGWATAPKGVVTTYPDLYDEKYCDYLKKLDFSAKGPGRWNNGRDMNWGEYITLICTEFRDAINTTVGNYMLYLEPDEIELFQSFLSSVFMDFSVTGIPLLLTSNMKLTNYHLFDVNGYNGTKEYLDLLKQLVGIFNIYCSPEDIIQL
jgi:hypothetical protein